ncbi:ParA family protein [Neobacillus niacini]|uniref:ParA family protein n=1 Tax=Neobacillus niacini TaxID=86668 RepID=UPI002FFDE11C
MSAKVIALSTNKGGVLKTSVTAHLAPIWAKQGKKVLIIDMDGQGNSAMSFGKIPKKIEDTMYDVLIDGMAAEVAIMNVYENIDLLPSNKKMRFFENDLKGPNKLLRLKNAVNHLRKEYDVILVDSPPTLGTTQGNILAFVDQVIIPFQPEPFSQLSLVEIVEGIEDIQENLNKELRILGILATLVDSRAGLHSETIQEARAYCDKKGWYMFETVIPRSIRFATELKRNGLPATISLPKHPMVQHYFELAKEIEERW